MARRLGLWAAVLWLGWLLPPWAQAEEEERSLASSYELGAGMDFIDQLLRQGLPPTYGELLTEMVATSRQAAQLGAGSRIPFGKGYFVVPPSEAGQAAMREYAVRQSLKNVLDLVNDLNFALTTGGALYVGNYDDAAMNSVVFVLGKLANQVDAATWKYVGLSGTAVPAAALAAVQIWWESHKALRSATRATQLETFYGRVENLTRALGRGPDDDPFPPSRENIDLVHQQLVSNPGFRELFEVYVQDQLNLSVISEWFQPELLDRQAQEQAPEKIRDLHSHIRGLLGWLNRAAIERQQRARAQIDLQRLVNELRQGDMTNAEVVDRIETAVAMLGVVEVYLETAGQRIAAARDAGDIQTLQLQQRLIAGYVKDVIAWVPSFGEVGERRDGMLAELRARYAEVEAGLGEAVAEFRARLARQTVPPRQETDRDATGMAPPAAEAVDGSVEAQARSMLERVLLPRIRPYDWGGINNLDALRSHYLKLLERGQFRHSGESRWADLPPGRADLANELERAFELEDYAGALAGTVEEPARQHTLGGHYEQIDLDLRRLPLETLAPGYAGLYSRYYDELLPLRRRLEDVRPRTASVQAQLDQVLAQASELGARMREIQQARELAVAMARDLAAVQQQLDVFERLRTESWMEQVRQVHDGRARNAADAHQAYHRDLQQLAGTRLNAGLSQADGIWRESEDMTLLARLEAVRSAARAAATPALSSVSPPPPGTSLQRHFEQVAARFDPDTYLMNHATGSLREVTMAAANLRAAAGALRSTVATVESTWSRVEPYVEDIRVYVDPAFMKDRNLVDNARRAAALPERWEREAELLDSRAASEEGSWRGIRAALLRMAERWSTLTAAAVESGVMAADWGRVNRAWEPPVGLGDAEVVTIADSMGLLLSRPYRRLWSDPESARVQQRLDELWNGSGLGRFAREQAPWLQQAYDDWRQALLSQPGVAVENFISVGLETLVVVTASRLGQAEALLAAVEPGTPEGDELPRRLGALLGTVHSFDLQGVEQSPLYARYQSLWDRYADWARRHRMAREERLEQERREQEARRQAMAVTQEQVRGFYQSFIDAYARGNTRQLLNLLAPDWRAGDGADRRDVEALLGNSFRVFERIQYRILNMSLQPEPDGSMRVYYRVEIVGENRRQRLTHTEHAEIVEIVGWADGEVRILRTLSGRQWLQ